MVAAKENKPAWVVPCRRFACSSAAVGSGGVIEDPNGVCTGHQDTGPVHTREGNIEISPPTHGGIFLSPTAPPKLPTKEQTYLVLSASTHDKKKYLSCLRARARARPAYRS